MKALLTALMAWLGANGPYPVEGVALPDLRTLSAEALQDELTGGDPDRLRAGGIELQLFGLYARSDGPHGTIYILQPNAFEGASRYPDPTDNPRFREALLHELVHHLQYATHADASWPCPAYGEHQALRLGGQYLFQLGVPDPLPYRRQLAAMMAGC